LLCDVHSFNTQDVAFCGAFDNIFTAFRYYKRAYQELFLSSDNNEDKQSATSNSIILLPQYYRFGWLLFLSLREHVFSRFKDLVTCTNGLVSVLVSIYTI